MKRSSQRRDSVDNGQEPIKFRRQNPVSCQFCRSKKLKCDRAQPCANCSARQISCEPASGSLGHSNQAPAQINAPSSHDDQSEVRTLESRLESLEQAVFRKSSVHGQAQSPEAIEDGAISKTATWIEAEAGISHGPVRSKYLDESLSPLQDIPAKDWTNILALGSMPLQPPLSCSEIIMTLPSKDIAELLFNHYAKTLNWVYHILHVPTTRRQLRGIYTSLEANRMPTSSHLALVASILAVAIYFRSSMLDSAALSQFDRDGSTTLGLLAQRALVEANHLTTPSLESLQTTIIMTQFLPNYGQTTSFTQTLTHTAHILQLHKVDSGHNCKLREETKYDAVKLEVQRRLWWYIVGTDWLLSFMSGPQCGTYVCHPNQMIVYPPSNLDDEDLTAERANTRPLSEPTEMSYSIGKIELAKAVRELVDEANESGLEVEEISYEQILAFDRRITEILQGLPWYYSMDEASRRKTASLEKEHPYIGWQRNLIHFGIYTRLSRLHRPYLARGYKDPRYAYSRMICLRSARKVIEMEQQMRQLASGFNPDSTKLWIIVHHVFVATVTLVMDYVCHKDDPQAAERKKEILNCYKTLESSQADSAIAKRGLAHLKQIMKDWMTKGDNQNDATATFVPDEPVRPPVVQNDAVKAFDSLTKPLPATSFSLVVDSAQEPLAYSEHADLSGFDVMQDLWQDPFDFSGLSNDPQWETLFRDLECQQFG